ncbi:hypothetical protein K8Q93_01820 [Candidatus Parcubacteria bacterium]|nr:hypothetical protein [Candidatus Parcubacteria bacterium]
MDAISAASRWGQKAFPGVVLGVEFPRKLTQQVAQSHEVIVTAAETLRRLDRGFLVGSMEIRRGFHLDTKV